MKKHDNICELVNYQFTARIYEPKKRIKCLEHVQKGKRNLPESQRLIAHKYEIIGGISRMSCLAENLMANNKLLERLKRQ